MPKDQACGPLASYYDSYMAAAPLFGITEEDLNKDWMSTQDPRGSAAIWSRLIINGNSQKLSEFLIYARSDALASKGKVYTSIGMGLPDDQRKRDVLKWWNMMMSTWQMAYINAARGPNMSEFKELRLYPVNDTEKTFCENQVSSITPVGRGVDNDPYHMWPNACLLLRWLQKVLSTAHTSFSIFGLCFTLATGAVIILISYILDPIFECLHTQYRHKSYQHLEWRSNATLQIHRLAEEQTGFSTWENCTALIPTTRAADDDAMSSLDITDPSHPKLRRPASKTSGLPLDDLYDEGNEEQKAHNVYTYTSSGTTELGSVESPVSATGTVAADPGMGEELRLRTADTSRIACPLLPRMKSARWSPTRRSHLT